MKKICLALCMILILSCNKTTENIGLDLVNGLEPMHKWDQSQYATLDQLKNVPDSAKQSFLRQHWPHLSNDVLSWIHRDYFPHGAVIDTPITFLFGSAKRAIANDHNMIKDTGYFNDQLVAQISVRNDPKSPYYFFVRCTNGMSDPVDANMRRLWSERSLLFTISRGEGLCHHTDYKTSIMLARRFGLMVYRGKIQTPANRISYDEAMGLELETDRIQVTVGVETGDIFDLQAMTYNGRLPIRN